jgi:hypothetical protein
VQFWDTLSGAIVMFPISHPLFTSAQLVQAFGPPSVDGVIAFQNRSNNIRNISIHTRFCSDVWSGAYERSTYIVDFSKLTVSVCMTRTGEPVVGGLRGAGNFLEWFRAQVDSDQTAAEDQPVHDDDS